MLCRAQVTNFRFLLSPPHFVPISSSSHVAWARSCVLLLVPYSKVAFLEI